MTTINGEFANGNLVRNNIRRNENIFERKLMGERRVEPVVRIGREDPLPTTMLKELIF
jgi:hypothetical protein